MCPVIGQIWLTVAKACSFVSAVMLGYSLASSALARAGSVFRIFVASVNTCATLRNSSGLSFRLSGCVASVMNRMSRNSGISPFIMLR